MARPLRVLLVSPVPGLDPPTGDVTYTEELLRHPPDGVVYETYDQALAAGRLVEHARRGRRNGRSIRDSWWLLHQAALNRVRRAGLLWREPFRYLSVSPGHYDLIHVHVFAIRWVGESPPVLLSNGAPQPDLYRDGYGWSQRRVSVAWALERLLSQLCRVDQPVCRIRRARAVISFTDDLRDFYLRHQLVDADHVRTIPCPTEPRPRPTLSRTPTTVGFVARNFAAKGGNAVLAAWPAVRAAVPHARLLLAGSTDLPAEVLAMEGVESLGPLPRERLMTEFFENVDVYAYPTTFDGGSLVMQEALAHGIPTVTSSYGPMPEMIGHGEAGAVVRGDDSAALAEQIVQLLDPGRHAEVALRAAAYFDGRFSTRAVVTELEDEYRHLARPRGALS